LDAVYIGITAGIYSKSSQKGKASCYLKIVEKLSSLSQQNMFTVVSVGIRGMDDKSPKSASIIKGVVPNQFGIRWISVLSRLD
jgi:hypothetical protein